ncbi:MAG: nucleotidyltransferase domain-containing protein [Candidatus Gracilibacteria bacterium]|nr:nucleotidyltransferase domain-containing protein [Candidatus Gracilibacteria bacterium]
MLSKDKLIDLLKSVEIKSILKEIGVEHLYLVGSYSRGDYNENSDIDLIYQQNGDIRVGGIKFLKVKSILESRLNKKVELVEDKYINKNFKSSIEKDKKFIF